MRWELERHDWQEFGTEAAELPERIAEFVRATDPDRADVLLDEIEAVVAPADEPLEPAAAAVASCLVQGLCSATPTSRVRVLMLLARLAGRALDGPECTLARDIRREVGLGLPFYAELAETGSRGERLHCIDLLSTSARADPPALARAVAVMRRIAALGGLEAMDVAVELDDLARRGARSGPGDGRRFDRGGAGGRPPRHAGIVRLWRSRQRAVGAGTPGVR